MPSFMTITGGQAQLDFANSGAGSIGTLNSRVYEFYLKGSVAISQKPNITSSLV
jgi:hypothetical protein